MFPIKWHEIPDYRQCFKDSQYVMITVLAIQSTIYIFLNMRMLYQWVRMNMIIISNHQCFLLLDLPGQSQHLGQQVHVSEQNLWHTLCYNGGCQMQLSSLCFTRPGFCQQEYSYLFSPAVLCQVHDPLLLVQPCHHRHHQIFLCCVSYWGS